jgi:uncharacterized repeat protein (TIGR01451 family)
MRNNLRYLLIVAVLPILSVLLLPGISAARKDITQGKSDGSSLAHEPLGAARFLIAGFLAADEGFADMGVVKTASSDEALAGSNLTYTIEVRNAGPEVALAATMSDDLPPGMTFVSLSAPAGWICSTPDVGSGGNVTCTNAALAEGSDDFFTLVVNIPSATEPGTFFINTATVSTVTPDPNEENNSYPAGTTVTTTGTDVSVTKSAGSEQVAPGANLTYTIEVRNGPRVAANVTLSDTLPGDTTFVSLSAPAGWTCSTPSEGSGGTVTCSRASLAPTNGVVFTLVVNVPTGAQPGTTYSNTATVSTTTTDTNSENDSSTVTTDVASTDLSVTKVDSPDPVIVENNITYTITAANAGPGSANSVVLSDTLPAGTTFVSVSAPGGWVCDTPAVGAGGTVTCDTAAFGPGSAVFTLVVKAGSSLPGGAVVSNTATIFSPTPDPNVGNESSTATTNVLSPATLSGTKTVSGQFTPGGNVTYNVVLSNTGIRAQSDNPGNEFTDVLPAALTLVSATASSGAAAVNLGTNTVVWNGIVPSGNSVAISIQATIKSGTAGQTISNQGTISYDADGNGTNEASTVTDDPSVAGNGNPTSFVPKNSPTISAVAVTRTAADPVSNSTIANVNDVEDAENTLSVTVNNGASATVNGVTVSNISVSAAGVVTANVVAACGATNATFTLKVTDSDGFSNTAPLTVTVNTNTAPTLSYSSPQTVAFGGSLTINPATGPSDNGSVSSIALQSQGTYTGSISVNSSTGAVSVSNAAPSGAHTITIRATDNCGTTTDASFNLSVGPAPTLSINNVSVTEGISGTTDAVFTVTLSAAINLTTKVDYQTADATALAGSDYQPTSGTLTFNPGETTKSITVPVVGDDANEPDETFQLNLSNPQNATLAVAQGTGTIINDDIPTPTLSINNVSVTEGISGTTDAVFTVTLSAAINLAAKVDYQTADATALSSSDYQPTGGTLIFNPGEIIKSITVPVNGDNTNEPDETFQLNLTNPQNATLAVAQGTGTIINDDVTGIQLSSASYSFGEGAGHAAITVIRAGDPSGATTVDYKTSDLADLNNCDVNTGDASSRCDYTAVGGTLNFAAGEASKTFTIPIIDDVYVEGPETLTITLSNVTGALLGTPATAAVTINDNDAAPGAPNPIDTNSFFIRQLYLDFLNREPDPPGLAAWLNTLNNCPAGDTTCDRVEVASAFFRSPEAFDRSYFLYKFYEAALIRQPQYGEFQQDLRLLTGFLTTEELEQRKQQFVEEFVNRAEFHALYDSFANGQPFVDAVLARAGAARPGVGAATVTTSNRMSVINRLGAGQITRGQALRELMEAPEISRRFFNKAFVVVGYFSFLRRNPDAAYLHWINVLNTTGDYREMIWGFMDSPEFRSRFGQAN